MGNLFIFNGISTSGKSTIEKLILKTMSKDKIIEILQSNYNDETKINKGLKRIEEIQKKLSNFSKLLTITTRDARKGEVDMLDYHFMTLDEFNNEDFKGLIVDKTNYAGNMYGIHKYDMDNAMNSNFNFIVIVDYNGIINIKKMYPDNNIITVHFEIDLETLHKRLVERKSSNEEIEKRINILKKNELAKKESKYIIDSTKNLDECFSDFYDILLKENII